MGFVSLEEEEDTRSVLAPCRVRTQGEGAVQTSRPPGPWSWPPGP